MPRSASIVALGAWLFGFPNPVIFGVLAVVLNYVPYIGPASWSSSCSASAW